MSPETPAGTTSQSGSAFCFRVKQQSHGWNVLHPVLSNRTIDLAALLCSAPEFLAMGSTDSASHAAVVLSERGEARVVVAIDQDGRITLVGCPAEPTREALTAVTQELLSFSGRLWRMPAKEFSSVFEKRFGQNLVDYFSNRVAIGWSESEFHTGLGLALEHGHFPVVLMLGEAGQESTEAASHLRSFNIEVKQLGVELYESAGVEIVMPRVLDSVESGLRAELEEARQSLRPVPSDSGAATGLPASVADVPEAEPGPGPNAESTVDSWCEESASPSLEEEPQPAETASPSVEAVSPVTDETVAEPESSVVERPGSPEPAPPPAPTRLTSAAPPAARPSPVRQTWDGTMPGVMAGKRPARRAVDAPGSRREHDQASGRH